MSDCRFGVSPVNYPDPDPEQVAYETELSGTPTAVFTEIQLIGHFLVLGIIILI